MQNIPGLHDMEYYVMFSGEVGFLPDASLDRHAKYCSTNVEHSYERCAVCIFNDVLLHAENEQGLSHFERRRVKSERTSVSQEKSLTLHAPSSTFG